MALCKAISSKRRILQRSGKRKARKMLLLGPYIPVPRFGQIVFFVEGSIYVFGLMGREVKKGVMREGWEGWGEWECESRGG